MNVRDLKLRIRALLAPRRVERELDEELAFHLERETERYVQSGIPLAEARTRARARFGSIALAADQCRDARGTAFVDDCVRDVQYALRTFRRTPLVAGTIVSTVALGLGLIAVVFTFFNAFMFRADAVRNPGELFGVERWQPGTQTQVHFTRAQYDALRRDTTAFSDAAGVLRGIGTRIDGRAMNGNLVTGNFFQVLGVNAALGRTLTPADDQRFAGRQVIVLSHDGWSRHFARDPAVVGRTVLINGFRYEIAGVAPEGFRGLRIGAPDYWAPLSTIGQFRRDYAGREDEIGIEVIGRLGPGLTPDRAALGLTVWSAAVMDGDRTGRPAASIRLKPRTGTVANDAGEVLLVFTPLFVAFGLVLLIGCANAANLLLARGMARQREIGIRLAIGASRRRIVRQLLTESLLLALASAAFGLLLSRVLLHATLYVITTTMPREIAESFSLPVPGVDWRVHAFMLAAAIAANAFFGLAPALQATRLELVRTMRGELTRDARPNRARNTLVAAQVAASALLLICAAVFLRSALGAASADIGLRTADVVTLDVANEAQRAAVVRAVSVDPLVAGVAASQPGALESPRPAFAETADRTARRVPVGYRFVSSQYFSVLDIPLVRGRGFSDAERSAEHAVAVVSETAARELWPDGGALGRVLRLEIDPKADRLDQPQRPFTVVGVVRDVPGFRLAEWPLAGVYLPTAPEIAKTRLTLRVRGDADQARAALFERLTTVDPATAEIATLRMMAGLDAYLLRIGFWVSVVLAALALALTLSGLFSVLSYVVEQRRKEIGVRMALGATSRNVTRLVLAQVLRQVVFGVLAGSVLAGALAIVVHSTQLVASIEVFDPVAYAASGLCIVTACLVAAWLPAVRAARIDPIATLRAD